MKILVPLFIMTAGLFTPFYVTAQESAAIEEVIVTAQKREQSAQNISMSLTTYSSSDIAKLGLKDLASLEVNTTSFTLDNQFSATRPRVTIRGIGSNETGVGGDPSSVVFVDGIYLPRVEMLAFDDFDLQRIEVLKGPQGTLYGKNVVGGAINLITNKPTNEREARIQATVGTDGRLNGKVMANAPLSDTVQMRFVAASKNFDGYGENAFLGQDLYDESTLSGRVQLNLDINDTTTLLFSVDGQQDDGNGVAGNVFDAGAPFQTNDLDGAFNTTGNTIGVEERDNFGVRAELNSSLSVGDLTALVGYRDLDSQFLVDFDGQNDATIGLGLGLGQQLDGDSVSTELRLASNDSDSSIDWVTGLYYFTESGRQLATFEAFGIFAGVREEYDSKNDTDSFAVFGELGRQVTDSTRIFGGLRYTDEEKTFSINNLASTATALLSSEFYGVENVKADWSRVTWRAGIEYVTAADHLLYGTVSSGFKSGGFQDTPDNELEARTPFDQETVINYEAGLKADWTDRLRTNFALFFMDYEDLQVAQVQGGGASITTNAASAEVLGFETEITWLPTDNLTVDLNYAWLDATFKDFIFEGDDLGGKQLERTPEQEVTLGLDYQAALSSWGSVNIGGTYNYRTEVFDDFDNNAFERRAPRSVVDAYARFERDDGKLQISVWGRNITDEEFKTSTANFAAGTYTYFGPPRTFGITATFQF